MKTKQATKSQILDLKVIINETEFLLGTLKFNLKGEIFWFYHMKSVHHISFHKQERHLIPNENEKYGEKWGSVNIPLLSNPEKIEFAFVEEFCLNGSDTHCIIQTNTFTPWQETKKQCTLIVDKPIATFAKPIDFSMTVMFVPKSIIPNDNSIASFVESSTISCKEKKVEFSSFLTSDASVMRKAYSENVDILIFIAPGARNTSKCKFPKCKSRPSGPLRIHNFINPLDSICTILKDRNHLIETENESNPHRSRKHRRTKKSRC